MRDDKPDDDAAYKYDNPSDEGSNFASGFRSLLHLVNLNERGLSGDPTGLANYRLWGDVLIPHDIDTRLSQRKAANLRIGRRRSDKR